MIKVIIPLVPVGQRRARSCVLNGHARTYKCNEQRRAEDAMLYYLADHKPPSPLDGPLILKVTAFLPIPASWSARKRSEAVCGMTIPTVRPDLDNMAKHVLDCMGQLQYFRDDCQVADAVLSKRYATDPRWEVEIGPSLSPLARAMAA